VHDTVLAVWPRGRDHHVRERCWCQTPAVARPLSLDGPRAAQCRATSVALHWPALAGRGLAPDAAVPSVELSYGDGCITGPTWRHPTMRSTYRLEAACLHCHVGTKVLIACLTARHAWSVTPITVVRGLLPALLVPLADIDETRSGPTAALRHFESSLLVVTPGRTC
jgi:hypothetical protein